MCLANSANVTKVLGLKWAKGSNTLILISRISQNETKRSLIHFIASIFDPLALTIPVILNMKELYQDACKQKLKWDKILPVEFHK